MVVEGDKGRLPVESSCGDAAKRKWFYLRMVDAEKIFVDNSQSSKLYFHPKPIQNSQKTVERHSDIEEIEFYFLKQVFSISLIVPITFRFGFAATDLCRLIFFFLPDAMATIYSTSLHRRL